MSRLYPGLVTVLVLFACCHKDNTGGSTVASIDVELKSGFDSSGGISKLVLNCSTGSYSSSGYTLNYTITTDAAIVIRFGAVSPPVGGSLTVFSPARASINLGSPATGIYPLMLENGPKRYNGTLIVTDSNFRIAGDADPSYTFQQTTLNKLPANTVWGYASCSGSKLATADSFMAALRSCGCQAYVGPVGYYDVFSVYPGALIDPAANGTTLRAFIFHFAGSWTTLGALFSSYKNVLRSDFSANLYSADGKAFMTGF